MKLRTFKAISEDIENLAPITSKATFLAALPLLVEMTTKIGMMRKTIRKVAEQAAELNDACSDYALNHVSSVFVAGLVTDGKGVQHGDVDLDGVLYHFSAGFGKLIRIDGDNITQSFVDGLPDAWKKDKVEIDLTAISRLGVTEAELEKAGLVRSANNVWSLPVESDDASE